MERKREEKGRHHICEGGRDGRLRVCLTGKEREEEARPAAQSFVKHLNCLVSYMRESLHPSMHPHMQLFPHLQDFLHSDSFPQTHAWCFSLSVKRPQ